VTEPTPLLDAMGGMLNGMAAAAVREPVVRHGERPPLHPAVRRAVLLRDGYRCRWCGNGGLLEIDHIVPWSAGGSDRSDNLRTLCQACNQHRSNYPDAAAPVRVQWCAVLCDRCQEYETTEDAVRAFCMQCHEFGWVSFPELLL